VRQGAMPNQPAHRGRADGTDGTVEVRDPSKSEPD